MNIHCCSSQQTLHDKMYSENSFIMFDISGILQSGMQLTGPSGQDLVIRFLVLLSLCIYLFFKSVFIQLCQDQIKGCHVVGR